MQTERELFYVRYCKQVGLLSRYKKNSWSKQGTHVKGKIVWNREEKLESADFAICTATTEKARKQALKKKSMMTSYGTSCLQQILDEKPTPQASRKKEMQKERVTREEEKKQLF